MKQSYIKIKPLTVNQVWKGRRFKTAKYKDYENELMWLLGKNRIPSGKLKLEMEVGLSSKLADVDNILKPFIDVLQKKYQFNDRDIYEINITKSIVKKGEEFIKWRIKKWKSQKIK